MNYIQYMKPGGTTENKKETSKFIEWLNKAGKSWKDFWDKPVTVQYAYNPHAVVGNGGTPFSSTQRRGDFATQAVGALAVPATAAGVATVGLPATAVGMVAGIGAGAAGSAGGSKLVELAGGDENAQEMAGDIAGFTLGAIAGGKATKIPRVVKGTYDTFGSETNILNRLAHPITTLRVGNIQSKFKNILPDELYSSFLNKLKTLKYKRTGPLAYNPSTNAITGVASLQNDNYGLAHELGHVVTIQNMIDGIPDLGFYYNISAPKSYDYNPLSLHKRETVLNEFYSDLIASQLGYKPSLLTPYRSIIMSRYKTTLPFIKELLFTNNANNYKVAEYPDLPITHNSEKALYKLNTFKHNLLTAKDTNDTDAFKYFLNQFNDFVYKYGFNKKQAAQFLKDIGVDETINELGIKPQFMELFKSGGTIHIKKKNLGSFTRYCDGKVTEECIRKGKNSSNPTTRKRATFAWVARHKFKHEDGGKINYLNYFQHE